MDVAIDAVKVANTPTGPVPVVLLRAPAETDFVPIFIGFDEAASIAHGLDAEDIGRPLTHDLTLDIIEELGGRVERVVISDIEDGTYFADLHLATPRDGVVIDARPSDSLALAARTNARIEMTDAVFEHGRRAPDEFDDLDDIRDVMDV